MDFLVHLWLPIVASAAAVWILSAVIWMALPHHHRDYDRLPDEKAFMDAVRSLNIPPGNYGFPYFGDRASCNTPEAKKAWQEGPLGVFNNWKPGTNMARNLVLTFLVYLAISVLVGYLAWHAEHRHAAGVLASGTRPRFADIMQITGTAGVLAYAFAFLPSGIWFQAKPRALLTAFADGVVYGLATGAGFAWLWPAA